MSTGEVRPSRDRAAEDADLCDRIDALVGRKPAEDDADDTPAD